MLGAFIENKLVGILGCIFDEAKTLATIQHIAVSQIQQGQGIGKQMIQSLIQNKEIQIIIAEMDEDSVYFYKKLGFKCATIESRYDRQRFCCELKC